MDFAPFDTRRYPTLPVRDGYGEWAVNYEDTVLDLMDLRLLDRLREVDWRRVRRAADLACGTGRDITDTGLDPAAYDLVTEVLGDEHLADLRPLYCEAARLLAQDGRFVIVGYHPHFLMLGIVTHFDRPSGQSVAIESHVHLTSDHVAAAHAAGLRLIEMVEGVIDDAWIVAKPKWATYRHHPVSFAMVWKR
jgi:SAM-dependent methyltransferase